MNRRTTVFVVLAIVMAALFVRLGFWQLKRLRERRARNADIAARMMAPPTVEALRDTLSFRRARLAGLPDYQHEFVFTGRSRNGSPGVYVFTPLRANASDTAVLVLRGWVYAPDAATVDLSRWHESRHEFSGYVAELPAGSDAGSGRKLRKLTVGGVRSLIPYPVARMYLVAQDSGSDGVPARIPPPVLDDGPHLSYAIQWFSFALIALGGTIAVIRRGRSQNSVA